MAHMNNIVYISVITAPELRECISKKELSICMCILSCLGSSNNHASVMYLGMRWNIPALHNPTPLSVQVHKPTAAELPLRMIYSYCKVIKSGQFLLM